MKNTIIRATENLYYRIHKDTALGFDYLEWAYKLLEADQESVSLKKLASLNKRESIFVFQDYLNRALNEIGLGIPKFEDCARSKVEELCRELVHDTRDIFEVTKEIFKVTCEIGYPLDLSIWIELDDGVDRLLFDDEYYKPNEKELKERIKSEAKAFVASREVEDIR